MPYGHIDFEYESDKYRIYAVDALITLELSERHDMLITDFNERIRNLRQQGIDRDKIVLIVEADDFPGMDMLLGCEIIREGPVSQREIQEALLKLHRWKKELA